MHRRATNVRVHAGGGTNAEDEICTAPRSRVTRRACAIVPALLVLATRGEDSAGGLLVLSQVVLGLQLPFALYPLLRAASDARRMGELVSPRWMRVAGWAAAGSIVVANVALVVNL